MAVPSTTLLLCGGYWIKSPANLTTGPAYGGTVLGTWQELKLRIDVVSDRLSGMEFGSEPVDELYRHEVWQVSATLRGWDTSGVQAAYPGAAAGAGSVPLLTYPGGVLTRGEWLTDLSAAYLFVPYAALSHPAIVLHNAVPAFEQDEGLRFNAYEDLFMRGTWLGLRDGSGRVGRCGLLAELTL